MLFVDNLKNGYAALWAKAKAYADGKIRDDQTNTTNTWSSRNLAAKLDATTWRRGDVSNSTIDSLYGSAGFGWYYRDKDAGLSILVNGVNYVVDQVFVFWANNDDTTRQTAYAQGGIFYRSLPSAGTWGAWEQLVDVDAANSNVSLADYVNSLS